MNILVTGGAGYIGSHTALILLNEGHNVSIIDNLSNSKKITIKKLQKLSEKKVDFQKIDLSNKSLIEKFFQERQIDGVVHFAGLKAVAESVKNPLSYFENNIIGTINLLDAMKKNHIKKFIFSSSATVYGDPEYLPMDEKHPTSAINPYGRTKLHLEEVIRDICFADKDFSSICLRYFNPIGAHESGLIGESPNGVPNNLMPYLLHVASGQYPLLKVYGNDYDTKDGTGIRDYVHVQDIARGHLSALEFLFRRNIKKNFQIFNLGTGHGNSVLEIINNFEKVTNVSIPIEIASRRAGDVAASYADTSKAENVLNWSAKMSLNEMLYSAWNFHQKLSE